MHNWKKTILKMTDSMEVAVKILNQESLRIVMVVDDDERLIGSITDGDIRRGLMRGHGIDAKVTEIMVSSPLVASESITREKAVKLMLENKIHHLPVVDKENHLLDLYLLEDEFTSPEYENTLVIMAGGFGKRLLPHTEDCPKPMLPISGKPMLEHILERAILQGFNNFVISVILICNFGPNSCMT